MDKDARKKEIEKTHKNIKALQNNLDNEHYEMIIFLQTVDGE